MPEHEIHFRLHDDPEANGRKPEPGDVRMTIHGRLDTGEMIFLHGGKPFEHAMREMFFEEAMDTIDVAERKAKKAIELLHKLYVNATEGVAYFDVDASIRVTREFLREHAPDLLPKVI